MEAKRPIIYIAGKMRGLEEYGRPRFHEAAQRLGARGFIVLNPALLPIGMPNDKYMPICLAMLDAADCVYMLNNWQDSEGAKLERQYAICQGKDVFCERDEPVERT